ncbi:MAG: GNAT family N-acetyltransferase [Acidimicrobiia bacterium]|nr:GNAT family N-acetyltransferase [Acidimicrobiia bacterium]MDH5237728.1 GNAT family N-acetyltransferase [Acidimicrobiia bacterium]
MTDAVTILRGDEAPEALRAVEDLRVRAWAPILGPDTARQRFGLDQHDRSSLHCVVHDRGSDDLVAAGRVTVCADASALPEETSFAPYVEEMRLPIGVAGRLVVDPGRQGEGLAERIIVSRLSLARELGLAQVWSETRREQAHGFVRHGYRLVGPSPDRSVIGSWQILVADLSPGGDHRPVDND